VQFTNGDGTVTTVGNVAGKAACSPTRGGWYYDVNPGAGGKPTEIVACDATCTALRMDPRGQVDIVLGCQTVFFEYKRDTSVAIPSCARSLWLAGAEVERGD